MFVEARPRIERALRYICDHLAEPLALKDVASAAHLSEFHFHRLFVAIMGEPVGRFITRKRLELAALRLAYEPRRSITDVALSSGYSSSSNFTKAFSAYFGCSPSQLRKPSAELPLAIGALTARYGKNFAPTDLQSLPRDVSPEVKARELAALQALLRYHNCPGLDVAALASPEGYDLAALMDTWQTLIANAYALGIAEDDVDAYGIAHDSPQLTAPERCRYHACVPCPSDLPLPAPLFHSHIPAGRYAVFRYAGSAKGVEEMYRRIYSVWLPMSGVSVDHFGAVDHYVNDFPENGQVDMEIWIKLLTEVE